eukprot:scaffold36353_cov64-Phaeocystis_antarctica.AAC.6
MGRGPVRDGEQVRNDSLGARLRSGLTEFRVNVALDFLNSRASELCLAGWLTRDASGPGAVGVPRHEAESVAVFLPVNQKPVADFL